MMRTTYADGTWHEESVTEEGLTVDEFGGPVVAVLDRLKTWIAEHIGEDEE